MEFLSYIYLFYMFIALYMTSLFVLLYIKNRNNMFDYPKAKKEFSLSIIVPAYNEEDAIKKTIEEILKSDYKGLKEIIVMNDGSVDKTKEIVGKLVKKYKIVKTINKENSGKADSINKGVKKAKGELVAVVDADSYPKKDAISKMVGFFNDKDMGVVTSYIRVKKRTKYIEKLQAIEYTVISWTRKLLEFVDSVYVTPGPLSIYKKSALEKVGGFDTKNLTEDIEITWRLTHYGYKRKVCLPATVYTVAPDNIRQWYRQRIRWNMGGFQTINKYKSHFLKKGMLGMFILPFFVVSLFLGAFGLGIFVYLFGTRFISARYSLRHSIIADTPFVTMRDLGITPSILNIFGIILFLFALIYTLYAMKIMKEQPFKKENFLYMPIYLLLYLTCYPIIIPISIYKVLRKDIDWGTK